jgi:exopolysaccharide biosynthesis polyprenyl glycosylphosphotransferase
VRYALLETCAALAAACVAVLANGTNADVRWPELLLALLLGAPLSLCLLLAFFWSDLYDLRLVRSFRSFAERLPLATALTLLLLVVFYACLPDAKMAGAPFITSLLSILAVVVPLRGAAYHVMRSGNFVENVLILGTCPLARSLADEIEARPELRLRVLGTLDGDAETSLPHVRHLGRLDELDRIVEATRPDRIVVALSMRRGRLPIQKLLACRVRGIQVEDGIDVYEQVTGKLAIEALPPSHLVFCRHFHLLRGHELLARTLSVLCGVVGLCLTAPLLLLIAVAIRLESKGPIFFLHERVGLNGRRFPLIKFRTMHPANRKTSEWVRDNGDRITRVGRVLRKFRLDELPQFVNVLRGDMNIVGPRPHPVANFELFAASIPYYSLRLAIRPGITGWAQIRYVYANNLEEETEKMRYDLYYIKHRSVWLDLRILFETVKIVLLGREQGSLIPAPQPQAAMEV